ncbi:SDR family oxidoreductase [Rubrivirga sp. S365]|uniref:SDR family oxidoreductase n=1 Tax=Rubrivirga sp. S365 TaxID=3076080 RepID=UPI0028C8901F|nr:SDR family oxidoreductase [Rubrivirga sp. S365]MDT7858373.1 SDR family oxidoreductase [Rubrivirga sp. S365]
MPRPLSQQVVVITGASSGAGLATAQAAAARGARVVMAARNASDLEATAAAIRADGGDALAVPTDVTDAQAVEALAERAVEVYGRIDTWVNNAGVTAYARFQEQAADDFWEVMRVNVLGQVHGAKSALPHLERTSGALICTGSVLSDLSVPTQAAYCASKHAVKGFVESLRIELAQAGSSVRVTLIRPASMNTPLFEKAKTQLGAVPQPLGPTYQPEVYAEVVLRAAQGDERDAFVGGAGWGASLMARVSPTLVSAFVASPLATPPASDRPKSAGAPDNLYGPVDHDGGVRGLYSDRALAHSPYLALAGHSVETATVAAAAVGAGAGVAARRGGGRTLPVLLGLAALAFVGKAVTSALTDR